MNGYVIPEPFRCTGCSACRTVCPKGAITVREDPLQQYGLCASIEEEKCIHCDACRKVCPVLNPGKSENSAEPECYAVCADRETLEKSASGGAFTLLAESVLEAGGAVAGAAFDENLRVSHILIDKAEDLDLLRRSKYVQSDMQDVFRRIRDLISERPVLFVGTPCQVAGLRAVAGESENLYCVDLYCGHAPAPYVFRKYLEDTFPEGGIDSYAFRTKQCGWVSDVATITFKDGSQEIRRTGDDDYQKIYHSKVGMRKVCEHCAFSSFPRQGDLSIADFWWIEETHPELKNEMGTSAVLVNNEHGRRLFEKMKSKASLCEKVELSAMKKNRPPHTEEDSRRDRFYDLLPSGSFHETVARVMDRRYNVVLWGNWSEKNYGSELTYYALYQYLRTLGLEVLLLERPRTAVWGPNEGPVLFRENPYPAYAYMVPETKDDMRLVNEMSDTFMVGSDQIWHHDLYDVFGKVCYLDFIHDNKKKIAYSSSFGREYWSGDEYERKRTSYFLKRFDSVSVRESSGVTLCRDLFDVKAEWVVDPVFLCPKPELEKLAAKGKRGDGRFIGVYVLDRLEEKEPLLEAAEEQFQCGSHIILDAFVRHGEAQNREIITDATMEEWIANFAYPDFVITDSFHGMCLSILFHKPFIAISNEKRGAVRFRELLGKLHLEDRLLADGSDLNSAEDLMKTPVDYSKADQILAEWEHSSEAWLRDALQKKKEWEEDDHLISEENRDEDLLRLLHDERRAEELFDWHTGRLDEHDKIQQWHTGRLDEHDKIQQWHTGRLDEHDKIQQWHTDRLDGHDKIQQWHTDRLDQIEKKQEDLERQLKEAKRLIDELQKSSVIYKLKHRV